MEVTVNPLESIKALRGGAALTALSDSRSSSPASAHSSSPRTSPLEAPALVKKDHIFYLDVPGNATTGYRWDIQHYQPEYLEPLESKYLLAADPSEPSGVAEGPRVGTGGTQRFIFRPLKLGRTELVLQYKRKWEPEPIEVKRYDIIIS